MALAGVAGVIAGGLAVWAAGAGGLTGRPDRARIERIVHDYILDHPEILPEAMDRLETQKAGQAADAHRAALETPFAGAWEGSAHPDVTLVEFTDYACGYCRKSVPDLDKLAASDKGLRIVFREIPILSPESDPAARTALAAAQAGKFAAVHHALFAGGQLSPEKLDAVSRAAGLTPAAVNAPAVAQEIGRNIQLAQSLGVDATPTFVVGGQVLKGAVGADALADAIADARKARS